MRALPGALLPLLAALVAARPAPAVEPPAAEPRCQLEVSQQLPEAVEPDVPFSVQVLVRNAGAAAAEDVVLTDALPPGYELREATPPANRQGGRLSWPLGRLGPNEQKIVRLSLVLAGAAPPAPLRHVVEAGYRAQAVSAQEAPVRAAVLDVAVSPPPLLGVGMPAVVQVAVKNAGNVAAQDVSLQTLLPTGLANPQGRDLELSLASLQPGESRIVPLEVVASAPGQHLVRVTAQARGKAPVRREAVLNAEKVSVTVSVQSPRTLPEQLIGLFEMTVLNQDAAPVNGLTLTVALPPGLTFVRAGEGASYAPAEHRITWTINELRPGETRKLAWNGLASASGDQPFRTLLRVAARAYPEVTWPLQVLPAEGAAPRAPAPEH
jgi:hypothetical protein